MKMYELVPQMMEVQALLDEAEEGTDLQELLKDTLESLEGSVESKFEGMVKIMRTFEAHAKAIKEERDALYKKQQALDNKAKSVKEFISHWMITLGKESVKAGIFNIKFQNNPTSLDWNPEEHWTLVPEAFRTPQPDKVDAREFLKWFSELAEDEIEELGLHEIKVKQTRSIRIR